MLFPGIQLDIYFKNYEENFKFFIILHKDNKRINFIIDHYRFLAYSIIAYSTNRLYHLH